MSQVGEGAHDTLLVGDDPIVPPIVDIPPNEDLGLSSETMAAVEAAAVEEEEEALDQVRAVAEEIGSPINVKAPELIESTTVTTTTTTTVTEIDTTSILLTEVPMEQTLQENTILGKREKLDDDVLGFNEERSVDEESGQATKKVKAAVVGEPELAADAVGADAAVADAAEAVATKEEGEKNGVGKDIIEPVKLGPKVFHSGVEMFTYFYDLLHAWVSNVDVNKYEFLVLSDLITKGHRSCETKIGAGIQSFQIRFHPGWHSRCYYLLRTDGSVDDFSYRKCVDKIMPLPENMFSPSGDLLIDQLLGPGEDASKWSKKSKGKEIAGDGWRSKHSGQSNRGGGRGGRGGRRGGGRGWSR